MQSVQLCAYYWSITEESTKLLKLSLLIDWLFWKLCVRVQAVFHRQKERLTALVCLRKRKIGLQGANFLTICACISFPALRLGYLPAAVWSSYKTVRSGPGSHRRASIKIEIQLSNCSGVIAVCSGVCYIWLSTASGSNLCFTSTRVRFVCPGQCWLWISHNLPSSSILVSTCPQNTLFNLLSSINKQKWEVTNYSSAFILLKRSSSVYSTPEEGTS